MDDRPCRTDTKELRGEGEVRVMGVKKIPPCVE